MNQLDIHESVVSEGGPWYIYLIRVREIERSTSIQGIALLKERSIAYIDSAATRCIYGPSKQASRVEEWGIRNFKLGAVVQVEKASICQDVLVLEKGFIGVVHKNFVHIATGADHPDAIVYLDGLIVHKVGICDIVLGEKEVAQA